MISDARRDAYRRDGFIVVPDPLGPRELSALRQIVAELVAGAAAVDTHTAVYDLEPGHTRAEPRVRRIKTPHRLHPALQCRGPQPGRDGRSHVPHRSRRAPAWLQARHGSLAPTQPPTQGGRPG